MAEIPKKKKILTKLKNKYRLVVLNDSTFEENFSLKLTPLNLFTLVGIVSIALIALVISLVAFTPLREYIPGYADVNTRKELMAILFKVDSLENELDLKSKYITNINNIVTGNLSEEKGSAPGSDSTQKYQQVNTQPSEKDLELRQEIESQDQYSLQTADNTGKNMLSSVFFFTPLNGLVSASFDIKENHLGVDILAKENEAIKAALDGTVISADWTLESGYTIYIQHANNLISVYKHNSALLKKAGEFIKAGEVVAIVGNSGELTSGPHLHFELWLNGNPINPQDYMVF
ncbi:MAG: M23 family metallopeptidase [Bacteroidetes bacterium]|nr:M23 family metallopeptidase [Bacteroidota bacterium]